MDRLQAMTTFVAVVDAASFVGAARKLRLSPPVVTRAVAELEERLGLLLLTRTTRVVRVTEAGARYAEDCRRILAEVSRIEEAAGGPDAAPRGELTITAAVMFGQHYVVPIVVEYLRRHRAVEATCLFLDRVVNLVDEGVDVAVRIGDLPDSSLQATRVGRVRRLVVAAPAYLAEHGTPRRPEELASHEIISAGGTTPVPQWNFVRRGKPRGHAVHPRIRTTTNESAIAAALAGFGLTRLLSYQVAEHLERGTLVAVLEDLESPPLPVHVVHRDARRANQKLRDFIDLAVVRLRAHPSLR